MRLIFFFFEILFNIIMMVMLDCEKFFKIIFGIFIYIFKIVYVVLKINVFVNVVLIKI